MRDITDVDDPVDGSGQRYRAVIIFWQGYCFLLWSFSFCTLIISRLFIISLHQHNNKFLRFYLYLLIIIEIHDCLIISLLYTWQFFCSLRSTPHSPITFTSFKVHFAKNSHLGMQDLYSAYDIKHPAKHLAIFF